MKRVDTICVKDNSKKKKCDWRPQEVAQMDENIHMAILVLDGAI
jgi:hypothetical protein